MDNKLFFESSKQKEVGLLNRVNECISNGTPINERLAYDLANAKRSDTNWELFYRILEVPGEAESGYWNAINVACTLLMPAIRTQFSTSKNNRINERVEEDFLSEVKIAIRECIPGFDKEVSQFPNYVKTYLMHVGYVHDKDSSTYMEKKKGIRIYGQGALLQSGDDEKETSGDPYAQTKSSFVIEEELEKRERNRSSKIFTDFVIEKKINNDHNASYKDVAEAKRQKEALMHQTNHLAKKLENLSKDKSISTEAAKTKKEDLLSELKEKKKSIEEHDKLINADLNKTFVNACFWEKFLGGVSKLPTLVKESIYESATYEEER